jgi:RNA polymerase sigma-70 factor (ECF subfamily)
VTLPFALDALLLLALQPAAAPDDRALAGRIRQGDREAFRTFFDRHHGILYGFLRRRGLPDEVCEDIVQTAFVTIWERRAQIDEARSLRAFLFTMAYNRALNHFRDTARLAPLDAQPVEPEARVAAPDAAAEAGLLHHRLRQAIAALPERRRAVFELCFVQELTYREAADVLGIDVKTVENQMGRALKAVREHLAPYRVRG